MKTEKFEFLEKFDQVPGAMLKDVTASPEPSEISTPSGVSEVSDKDILEAGSTAETTGIPGFGGASVPPGSTGSGETSAKPTAPPVSIGTMIDAKFIIDISDSAIPAVLVTVISFIGYSSEKKVFQLTEKEKAILVPPMQEYLNSLNISFSSPFQKLLFALSVVYLPKLMEAVPKLQKTSKKQKQDSPASIVEQIEKSKEREKTQAQARAAFVSEVKKLHPSKRLEVVKKKYKLNNQAAQKWLLKYVS